MFDIELLKKYGIIGSSISIKKRDYKQLFEESEWGEPKKTEEIRQFYKHYDKFKRRKK